MHGYRFCACVVLCDVETVTDKLDASIHPSSRSRRRRVVVIIVIVQLLLPVAGAADLFIRDADTLCFNSNTSGPRAHGVHTHRRTDTPKRDILFPVRVLYIYKHTIGVEPKSGSQRWQKFFFIYLFISFFFFFCSTVVRKNIKPVTLDTAVASEFGFYCFSLLLLLFCYYIGGKRRTVYP